MKKKITRKFEQSRHPISIPNSNIMYIYRSERSESIKCLENKGISPKQERTTYDKPPERTWRRSSARMEGFVLERHMTPTNVMLHII